MTNKKIIIVGAGITGLTLANKFAKNDNKVTVIEKRSHLGGNCYDKINKDGILIHLYGPHIFHTEHEDVWNFLSDFTKWIDYEHEVLGFVNKKYIPIPFNFNSLDIVFPQEKAKKYEKKLISYFGKNKKVPILELRKTNDQDIRSIADFIYKKVFLDYTVKQWGLKPDEIDPDVTARVPVVTSRDNRYFQNKYQGIPLEGYSQMFEQMTKDSKIEIRLNTDFKKIKSKLDFDLLFYTGAIDEFYDYKFGKLGYRCAEIEFKTYEKESYQPASVVNYPDLEHKFTRITEFKKLTKQISKKTTIGKEYPGKKGFMSWPIASDKNKKIYEKYATEAEKSKQDNIYFAGRLAEFKYYDMDDAVKNSLDLFKKLNK
ncbi:MAG: UDP-galactopyranose mutase [Candidatus Thorarchaeota archaeon]